MPAMTLKRYSGLPASATFLSLSRGWKLAMAGSASRRISPELVVAAGCAIALITAGPRATAGLFQIPMTTEYGWEIGRAHV